MTISRITSYSTVAAAALLYISLATGAETPAQGPAQENANEEVAAEAPPVKEPDAVQQLFARVNQALNAAETNKATQILIDGVDDPAFAERRPEVFSGLLRFLCYIGKIDEAKKQYSAVLDKEPELALAGLGVVYRSMRRPETPPAEVREWVQRLLNTESLNAAAPTITEWLLYTYIMEGNWNGLLETVPTSISKLSAEDAGNVLLHVTQHNLRAAPPEIVDGTLTMLESLQESVPKATSILASARTEVAAKRTQWDLVVKYFKAAAGVMGDAELERLIRTLDSTLKRAGKSDEIDAICTYIFDAQAKKEKSLRAAAGLWMDIPKMREDREAVARRMVKLMEMGIDPNLLTQLLNKNFYFAVEDASQDILTDLLDVSERLLTLVQDEKRRDSIKIMILDASFIAEDYDRAIRILEAGIPDRDEDWHAMALAKVKAHKAEEEENFKQAADCYREFMGHVAKMDEGQLDPTTGVFYTPEMTLGRNAIRIGKLLLKSDDKKGAQQAFEEARKYFATARKDDKLKPGSAEAKFITDELASIPTVDGE